MKTKEPNVSRINKSQKMTDAPQNTTNERQNITLLEQAWSEQAIPSFSQEQHARFWQSFELSLANENKSETESEIPPNELASLGKSWDEPKIPAYSKRQEERFWQKFDEELSGIETQRLWLASFKAWYRRFFQPQTGWLSYAAVGVFAIMLLTSPQTPIAPNPHTKPRLSGSSPKMVQDRSRNISTPQEKRPPKVPLIENSNIYRHLVLFQNLDLLESMELPKEAQTSKVKKDG